MFELTKESAVQTVLVKRFGKTNPEDIENLNEINIWFSADNAINELGICVELIFDDVPTENYQVNKEGIIYSWGKTPIIDKRSQEMKLNLEVVYQSSDNIDE